ncbi:MAG: MurR/RpiR family transcriptional regulator [Betaproteobacteria bacterium]|nr:MurR/RpiR family transcriptional regulator [Betaproteobacteria bacterium]
MPNATKRMPPESLERLRSLVAAIQSRKADVRLGARAARALASIVDAPGQTAICSISEVAEAAGVNASTLTRLSKKLGYSGFNEFQDVFRQHVADQQHFYSEQARRLLRGGGKAAPARSIAERIAEDETANIAGALQELDAEALGAAAQLLIAARRVRAYGARQMHAVAYFLSYGLGMLRSDVGLLGSSEHGMAHGLAQLEQGDALIVVGCSPYTRGTVDTARTAAGEGMDVIALTDSHASPLAAVARYTFVCDTGGSYFSNSSAALIVLAEILLTTLAERLGARTVQQLRRREALISQLGIEF